jgi:hypothetical protein
MIDVLLTLFYIWLAIMGLCILWAVAMRTLDDIGNRRSDKLMKDIRSKKTGPP